MLHLASDSDSILHLRSMTLTKLPKGYKQAAGTPLVFASIRSEDGDGEWISGETDLYTNGHTSREGVFWCVLGGKLTVTNGEKFLQGDAPTDYTAGSPSLVRRVIQNAAEPVPQCPDYSVGTILSGIIKSRYHLKACSGCSATIRKMDRLGPDGCEQQIDALAAEMHENAGNHSLLTGLVAKLMDARDSLLHRDPLEFYRQLIREAIAEARG